MKKDVWRELSPDFPTAYWDDHLRKPSVRKNRSVVALIALAIFGNLPYNAILQCVLYSAVLN